MRALVDEVGYVELVDGGGARFAGVGEARPVGCVDDLLVGRADDVVLDADAEAACAEDVGEALPPRGVEREDVGALVLREPLDQLHHRGVAVDRGARERRKILRMVQRMMAIDS